MVRGRFIRESSPSKSQGMRKLFAASMPTFRANPGSFSEKSLVALSKVFGSQSPVAAHCRAI